MIMMHQCRSIDYNKHTTQVRGLLIIGEAHACGGAGSIREISVPSSQFCCESKKYILKNTMKFERETMKGKDKFYILVH